MRKKDLERMRQQGGEWVALQRVSSRRRRLVGGKLERLAPQKPVFLRRPAADRLRKQGWHELGVLDLETGLVEGRPNRDWMRWLSQGALQLLVLVADFIPGW